MTLPKNTEAGFGRGETEDLRAVRSPELFRHVTPCSQLRHDLRSRVSQHSGRRGASDIRTVPGPLFAVGKRVPAKFCPGRKFRPDCSGYLTNG